MKRHSILVILLTLAFASTAWADDPAASKDEPKNEFYFDYNKARVSDLHTWWNTATPAYYRNTDYGKYGAGVNHLQKFGTSNQYFVDLNPRAGPLYGQIWFGTAGKSQINYPTAQQVYNLYFTTKEGVELSVGYGTAIYSNFSNEKIRTARAGVGYYFGNYFVFLKESHDIGQSLNFLQLGLTRYFSDKYNFVRVVINGGRLPDIGDVPPLDRLIKETQVGINANGQFSLTKCLYFRWEIGYTKMMYPFLRRYITDGTLGLLWRF